MLHAVRDDPEGKGLDGGQGIGAAAAVGQGPGQGTNLGDPAAVLFTVERYLELHDDKVARAPRSCTTT